MKTLNITFTQKDYERLVKARKEALYPSWEKFILFKCCKGISVKREMKK
jgi:hypothetical protein